MKIFVAGDKHISGGVEYLSRGFEVLGHTVKKFYLTPPSFQRIWALRLEKMPGPAHFIGNHFKEEFAKKFGEEVKKAILEFSPDFIFVIRSDRLLPATFAEIKAAIKNVPLAVWITDDPAHPYESWAFLSYKFFDFLFCPEPNWVAYTNLDGKKIYELPFGYDDSVFKPVVLEPDEKKQYAADISFVGSFSAPPDPAGMIRAEILGWLAEYGFNMAIYGAGIGWYAKRNPALQKYVRRKEEIGWKEVNKIFNASKIVLNVHHPQLKVGASAQTFMTAGAGAFQIVTYRPDTERFFPGNIIESFRTKDELLGKINFYLNNADERKKKAEAALKIATANHTCVNRASTILKTVFGSA
jgi:spore maturation protein CgeB